MAGPAVTYIFANSTVADASQVNQNFQDIINGVTDTTRDLSVKNLTIASSGALTNLGNTTLGNSSSSTINPVGTFTASLIPNAANTYDLGSSSFPWAGIYLGQSGKGFHLVGNSSGSTTAFQWMAPIGLPSLSSLVESDASGNLSYLDPASFSPSANFLINGNFDIWQRGTSVTGIANGSSTYGADRWYAKNSLGTNGVLRIDQTTGVSAGALYGCQVKISTAPTAGQTNGCELYQTIENLNSILLYNQTASFTVKVKALNNVNQVGIQFFYKTTEAKVDTAIGSEVTTTVNSSTFTSCTISGKAIGTAQGTAGVIGVRIRITGVSSGNTYDINNGFVVEQAHVALGTTAPLTFARTGESFQSEFDMCRRYYFRITQGTGIPIATGYFDSTTAANLFLRFPVPMRSFPNVGLSARSDFELFRPGTSTATLTGSTSPIGSTEFAYFPLSISPSTSTAGFSTFLAGQSSSAYLEGDSEI